MNGEKAVVVPANLAVNPASYVDPNGRVFEWEGRIYRAVAPGREGFCRNVVESAAVKRLQERGKLVETWVSGLHVEESKLVLEHRRVWPLSYSCEWPAEMLKDAALVTLSVAIELAECDLAVQDAHPSNVQFDGPRPIFIDFGSIVPPDPDLLWPAYQQFCHFFLYPLYLASAGLGRVVRLLLQDYLRGIEPEDLRRLLPLRSKIAHPMRTLRVIVPSLLGQVLDRTASDWRARFLAFSSDLHRRFADRRARVKFLRGLRDEVAGIRVSPAPSAWSGYYDRDDDGRSRDTRKDRTVREILKRLRPRSVLDIGCNRGRYTVLSGEVAEVVIGADRDEACIAGLYVDARKRPHRVLPLILDVLNPTPAMGWLGVQFPAATARLTCDLVLALAVVHHLAFRDRQPLERVARALTEFTRDSLLVEFVPMDDPRIRRWNMQPVSEYTLDHLTNVLRRHFQTIELFESWPEGRRLILCGGRTQGIGKVEGLEFAV